MYQGGRKGILRKWQYDGQYDYILRRWGEEVREVCSMAEYGRNGRIKGGL